MRCAHIPLASKDYCIVLSYRTFPYYGGDYDDEGNGHSSHYISNNKHNTMDNDMMSIR